MLRRFAWLCLGLGLSACSSSPSPEALVASLAQSNRVAAFAQLQNRDDAACRQAVLAGIRHPQARVRRECLRLMEHWQDATLVDSLLPLLEDRSLPVRSQCARTLTRLLNTEETLELLNRPETRECAQAALVSALLKDPLVLAEPGVLEWLVSPARPLRLRVHCLRSLHGNCGLCLGTRADEKDLRAGVLRARSQLTALARDWLNDSAQDLEIRASAALLYGRLAGSAAYAELLREARCGPSRVREAALVALAYTNHPAATSVLMQVAEERSQPLSQRLAALNGLTSLAADPGVRQFIVARLEDPDAQMRTRVAARLADIGGPQALAAVRAAVAAELDPAAEVQLQYSLRALESCSYASEEEAPHR